MAGQKYWLHQKKKNTEVKNKTPTVTDLVPTAALNTKATKIENEIPDITNVAIKLALNTTPTEAEGKIPNITNLERLKIKYLVLAVLLPLLSSID